ncbi:MAG: hypothetical protein QOG18_186 [Microbacteriaceae bacterium]|jgi:hypothetical protein|nr:hypothetical protein [Microbacteriaceae bacterium]MDQ1579158.1 hypothetical protein [Microbacteriaceae bacterium]
MNEIGNIGGLTVWNVLIVLQAVLFVIALITIFASRRYTGGGKFLWILLVFAWPLVGPIGWLIWGRRAQIRRG